MIIAGFVLGLVAIVLSFIPCLNLIAFIPAILGIVFSAIGINMAKKAGGQGRGMALGGLITSIVALVWIPIYVFIILAAAATGINDAIKNMPPQ